MKYPKGLQLSLLKEMIRIRFCEERFVDPIISEEIKCPVHLYSGQEAIAVGICKNLNKTDYVFGCHRSHGHFLAKGGSMKELVSEVFCRENGCSHGRGGSMHLIDPENGFLGSAPIVGGTISLALGAALASKIRNDKRVVISFFGDGATGEGTLMESLNFAAIKKLPIVFVCENNFYSTHMPIKSIRVDAPIIHLAQAFNIESVQIDGNNVLEVYELTKRLIEICRNDEGPVFIETLTYRQRGHVGPDDNIQGQHTDIRPKEEIKNWIEKDPIMVLKKYLSETYIDIDSEIIKIENEVSKEVDEAFNYAINSNKPKQEELLRYVFK